MRATRWATLLTLLALWLVLPRVMYKPATPAPAPQGAGCGFVLNDEHERISWKGKLPIQLQIHSSIPAKAYPAILKAINVYRQMLKKDVFVISEANVAGPTSPKKDGVSMLYWMKDWESDRQLQQARTTLYWSGDEIYEADIRINGAHFGYNFDLRGPSSSIDLQSLMVHELGHVLGLAHHATPGSVMNIWLDDGEIRRQLGTADLASLACEY